jgi:threonine synthase
LGYEICEQLGWNAPDAIVFPVTTGDTLVGTWRGCLELAALSMIGRVPRMFAAEVFGPLNHALDEGLDQTVPMPTRPSVAFSAAASDSAYQSLHAIRSSGGRSAVVGDDVAIMEMQLLLAQDEGIYAEAAAVMPLLAARQLLERGELTPGMSVVVVSTSGGMKDPAATQAFLPPIPVIEPTAEALVLTLRQSYGYDLV